MIDLGPGIAGVENEGDLRTAVTGTTYTTIYLVNDIVMTGAITITATKTALVIDGNYPVGSTTIHSLTDTDSTDYNLAFGIRGTSSIALTLRNLILHGRNYYGLPYIVENWPLVVDTSGVVVTYENVTYDGPQMTYNCYGRTRYINCDITIRQTGVAPAEEVGEVNRLEIGGTTTIYHTGAEDAVFWFNNTAGNSSLTILTGAQVDIESVSSYFVYNRSGGFLATVSYTLQANARLNLRVRLGMAFNANHTVSSFTVGAGAQFHYVQTAQNGTAATLYMDGAVTVGAGARFWMQAEAGTQPLIQFTSGTGRSLSVESPLSFVLYSPNTAALRSLATTGFALHGGQVNTWRTAVTPISGAGGFEDMAEYRWFKLNFARNVELGGTFTQTGTAATSNMEAADVPYPLDTDLHMHEARVLSVGDWPVTVNTPVVDDGRPITGQTEPQANLLAQYQTEGSAHSIPGRAGADGGFAISTAEQSPPVIPAGTEVAIWANIPFLIKRVYVTVVVTGELSIESAPVLMMFRPRPIALNPPLLPRMDPEEAVVIRDNRAFAGRWTLTAALSGPLTAPGGEVLEDGPVFLSTAGATPVALGAQPVTVFTGGPGQDPVRVFWPETSGILVRVLGPIRSGVAYTTQIIWNVAPLEE